VLAKLFYQATYDHPLPTSPSRGRSFNCLPLEGEEF
jgi:hypothetical protein